MSASSGDSTPGYKDADELRRLYQDEGLSQEEIGERFGVTGPTIHYWMKKHQIESISQAEAASKDCVSFRELTEDHYYQWTHFMDGNNRTVYTHRLQAVVACYPEDMPVSEILDDMDGKETHHKSGYGLDNRPDNLEMLTTREHHLRHNGNIDQQILEYLEEHEFARSVELQEHIDRSKPQTNNALNHLRDDGLVERGRHPDDGRVVIYSLTDAGETQ